jgi:hypothetical protein
VSKLSFSATVKIEFLTTGFSHISSPKKSRTQFTGT